MSNHYVVHLKLILYVTCISIKLKKKKKSTPLGCNKEEEENYSHSFHLASGRQVRGTSVAQLLLKDDKTKDLATKNTRIGGKKRKLTKRLLRYFRES